MGVTYDPIPDPQHVEAAKLGAPIATPDNPKGAKGRPGDPPLTAEDFAPAGGPMAPPPIATPPMPGRQQVAPTPAPQTIAANPGLAAKPRVTYDPTPPTEQEKWSTYLQSIGVNKDRSDKLAATMGERGVPAFPAQQEEEDRQQVEMQTGSGGKALATVGGILGGEAIGAGMGAYKAAQVARELQAINAARTASGVAKVADATEPYSWANASKRIEALLKDTQDAEVTGAPTSPGAPTWKVPGKLGPTTQDMTAEELAASKSAATTNSAKNAAVQVLKDPKFWAVAAGSAAGGSLWGTMSGIYHMRRTAQFLAHIFGE
jgi:hypothetical protein